MAKQTLASMSVDALLKLRNRIGAVLQRRAQSLKKELRSLGEDYAEVGRIAIYGKKKNPKAKAKDHGLNGRKVAAKYRDPKTGETWSGRGAPARWLTDHEKKGRKREQFLVAKAAKKAKRKKQ